MGDRYFYEHSVGTPYKPKALDEIRKITLSRILCDTIKTLSSIQPWALRRAKGGNSRVQCENIPKIDWNAFSGIDDRVFVPVIKPDPVPREEEPEDDEEEEEEEEELQPTTSTPQTTIKLKVKKVKVLHNRNQKSQTTQKPHHFYPTAKAAQHSNHHYHHHRQAST